MPKNPETLKAHKTFFTNRKFQKKIKGVPFDRIQKISKKNLEGPFDLQSTFGSMRKFCGLVRVSNPRSPASRTPENYSAKKLTK